MVRRARSPSGRTGRIVGREAARSTSCISISENEGVAARHEHHAEDDLQRQLPNPLERAHPAAPGCQLSLGELRQQNRIGTGKRSQEPQLCPAGATAGSSRNTSRTASGCANSSIGSSLIVAGSPNRLMDLL
jgi:hypothetical protein